MQPNKCAAANPAIALRLQSTRPVGRVAELGSLGHMKRFALIGAILLAVLGILFVPMRMRTVSEVAKIRALQGQVGEFSSLTHAIRTR